MSKVVRVLVMVAVLAAAIGTIALAGPFRSSVYGDQSIRLTTAVAFEWTNGQDRVVLGSAMVRADAASNTWTILVINNNYTNILKTGTLTASSNTLLYEGTGTVPIGGNGRIRFTGTVNTNEALTTNNVQFSIHVWEP